jgi:hypothetical protein
MAQVSRFHTLRVRFIADYLFLTGGKLNVNQDLGLKVAAPVGTLVGQLLFGWLADMVGRKRMCEHLPFWPNPMQQV